MDIKKFADGYGAKMSDLHELEKKQDQVIEEAKKVLNDALDQYFGELKDQVKLMTRDDMQEYLDEASKRDHDDHMKALVLWKALVLCAFIDTHDGRDKFVAANTLSILKMKMDLDDLSDMLSSVF